MARECFFCGKATVVGRQVSHAHNVTSRTWEPNLRRVRTMIDGTSRRVNACTRCIRSGRVQKPPKRSQPAQPASS